MKITNTPMIYDTATRFLHHRGYRLGKSIGEGSYCKVKTAIKLFENGLTKKVACKVIDKKKASNDFILKFLPRELSIIRNLKHPNIVGVMDIIDTDEVVYIFMNICERGDLLEYIRSKGPLPEYKAKMFFE